MHTELLTKGFDDNSKCDILINPIKCRKVLHFVKGGRGGYLGPKV